jgi:hypothetical protein
VPKIFEWNGYKFFFYSNEGYPLEPCHVHVRKGEKVAKFWIDPVVEIVSTYGFTPKDLTILEKCINERIVEIRRKWNEYFNPNP